MQGTATPTRSSMLTGMIPMPFFLLSCCSFHSINWGTGSRHWASEWFPPLLSSFTSYIKPAKRSWSDWAPSLISLSPLSSVNIKVLIRHGLHWVNSSCCHGIRGALSLIVAAMTSSHFLFFSFFPPLYLLFWDENLLLQLGKKKKQAAEENMSDDTRGADGSSERHQNKLWSLI